MDDVALALGLSRLLPRRGRAFARSCLVLGYNGLGNVGADLRTEALLRRLRELPGGGPRVTLAAMGSALGSGLQVRRRVLLPRRYPAALLRLILEHDAVLISEGCAFSDVSVGLYGLALALALRQGLPAAALGVGVSALGQEAALVAARWSRGALLTARDGVSLKRLEALGLSALPGADLAFDLGAARWPLEEERRAVLDALRGGGWDGVCPMVAIAPGPLRPDGALGDPDVEAYLDAIARAVRATRARRPFLTVIVGMDPRDRAPAVALGWRLGATTFTSAERSPHWIAALLMKSAVVISARYHGVLLGLCGGAAPVALAPDERLVGLLEEFEARPWLLEIPFEHPIVLRRPLERALEQALSSGEDERARRLARVAAQRARLDLGYASLGVALGASARRAPQQAGDSSST